MEEKDNVVMIQRNLRSTETIRPLSRYASQDQLQNLKFKWLQLDLNQQPLSSEMNTQCYVRVSEWIHTL